MTRSCRYIATYFAVMSEVYQPIDGYLDATHALVDEWNLRHKIYDSVPATHRRHLGF